MEKKFYEVKFTESAEKDLKKLNKSNKAIAKLLKKWISENLIGTQNPKQRGKALTRNLKGLWRYRVGSYRIVAEIKNDILLILIIEISDRKETYKDKKRKTYKDGKIKWKLSINRGLSKGVERGRFHTFFFISLAFSLVFLKKCCIIISVKNVFEKLIH